MFVSYSVCFYGNGLDTSSRTLFVCVSVGMSMSRRTSSYVSRQIVIERRVT